ncbi:hypothetical protein [Curtobacterium sp. MCBD17_032]|uniref:hypothetical protein n=1 Tax=Curtobacterium sp. MCBD17_032 TaxID=2175659 RepID=UPI000DAA9DEA|nr:hypothetical protein [Curtobacterium sp. MCBD17_032]PZE86375.1 hypothetical protein DEI91_04595 [Curtobacterium sp. MCBD17_032]
MTPWTNCSLGLGLVALLVGVVGLVVLPRGEAHQAHFVVALVVIGVAFVLVVVSVTRGARARRRLGAAYPSVSAPVVTDAVGGSRDAPLTGQVEASGRGIDPRTRA